MSRANECVGVEGLIVKTPKSKYFNGKHIEMKQFFFFEREAIDNLYNSIIWMTGKKTHTLENECSFVVIISRYTLNKSDMSMCVGIQYMQNV